MKKIVEDKRILVIYLIVIIFVVFGITYASKPDLFSNYVETSILRVDEEAYGSLTFDSSDIVLRPILDDDVKKDNSNIIYIDFRVGGSELNEIKNIIYDIALVDLEVDCDLLSPYMKWILVKNGDVISSGSLDYKFDTIKNGRLVLTPIQQDLKEYSENKETYDYYEFYMWISDSLQDPDLFNYANEPDQSSLVGKNIKGLIEVELYAETKKALVREPSDYVDTNSCIVRDDAVGD